MTDEEWTQHQLIRMLSKKEALEKELRRNSTQLSDESLFVPSPKCMWEILVPTERRGDPGRYYSTRYHKVWDEKVRAVSGGLTILTPAKGQWINTENGDLVKERVIPVRIIATREEIEQIVDMTLVYYDQLAVLCYKVSNEVILKHRKER